MAANEEIDIDVLVNLDVEKNTSLKDLKKNLKDLKSAALEVGEASPVFKKLTENTTKLQDKLDDLKDSAKSLQGTGIEKLKGSFGLLTESLSNFDPGKAKTALKGIGSAMSAIPIFLILEGIKYLVENFDELSKGSGILAKVLRGVGDIISWVTEKITWLTDKIGLTNSTLDKQGEAIETNAEKFKKALEVQSAGFDRQIAAAKAAGKSTVALEVAKQEAIVETNRKIAQQVIDFVNAGGKLTEKQKEIFDNAVEAIKDSKTKENEVIADDAKTKKEKAESNAKDQAALLLKVTDDARTKELLSQQAAYKENIKQAHGNKDLLQQVEEQNNLAVSNINFKYDKIEKEANAKKIKEIQTEEEAASEYLGKLAEEETKKQQTELDNQVEAKAKAEAEKLAASLETYAKEKKAREDEIQGIIKSAGILSSSFRTVGGDFANLAAGINDNLTAAFKVLTDKTKTTLEKISAGINALGSSINAILSTLNDNQKQQAEEATALLEKKLEQDLELVDTSKQQQLDSLAAANEQELSDENLTADQKVAIGLKYNAKKKAIEDAAALQEYQLKLAEYNRNTEVKKKAFEQDKKLRIAQTVISTITGSVAALTGMISAIPGPVGIILGAISAAAVIAVGAIQIAAINKQKFDAGSPPAAPKITPPSSAGMDDVGGMEGPNLKRVGRSPAEIAADEQSGSNKRMSGSNEPIKAYVVGPEITDSQNKEKVIENRASY